jgi:hypothetical protein
LVRREEPDFAGDQELDERLARGVQPDSAPEPKEDPVQARRGLARWAWWGAGLGFGLPLLWAGAWFAVVCCREDGFDLGPLGAGLLIVCFYTLSGLGLYTAAVGAACGLASAWLPRVLRPWQRGAALVGLLHAAGLLIFRRDLVPPFFVHFPGPF